MSHAALLGRDSWMLFKHRIYQTLPRANDHPDTRLMGELSLHLHPPHPGASAYLPDPSASGENFHLRYTGTLGISLSSEPQSLPVTLVRRNGSPALTGHYLIEVSPRIGLPDSTVLFVSDGHQHLPITGTAELDPGDLIGTASAPLTPVPLTSLAPSRVDNGVATVTDTTSTSTNVVPSDTSPLRPEQDSDTPPSNLIARFSDQQRTHFSRLWRRLPPHMRHIHFDLHGPGWTPAVIDSLATVLLRYSDRFAASKTDLGYSTTVPFEIKVPPGTRPIASRPYRSNPAISAQVNAILDSYLAAGFIQHSKSPWASPLVVVPKKDGSIRITVNYKRLNDVSIIGKLPIPRIDEVLESLGEGKVFTTFDLMSGFFQTAIHPDSVELTAFCTPHGLFEWLRMPQGASGAPGTFQRLMNRVTDGLTNVRMYIDDAIVFDPDPATHISSLGTFLDRLRQHNLKLAPAKARIGATSIDFLGYTISPNGLRPNAAKVTDLSRQPMPANISQLRSLLGGISYYRRFLPDLATRLRPIHRLLKRNTPFDFTPDMELLIKAILTDLSNPPVLVFPDWNAAQDGSRKFRLYCDASKDGFGATLEQEQSDGSVRPITFISRATLENERNWSILELEAGAIVWAIKRLRQYLFQIPFIIYTDHQALQQLPKIGEHKARVQRWLEFLTAYPYTIKYRRGSANANADFLSRLPLPATDADRTGPFRLTDPDDVHAYLIRPSRPDLLRTPPESSLGGLVSSPDNNPLGGLQLSSSDFHDFRSWGSSIQLPLPTTASVSLISDRTRSKQAARNAPQVPPPMSSTSSTASATPAVPPSTRRTSRRSSRVRASSLPPSTRLRSTPRASSSRDSTCSSPSSAPAAPASVGSNSDPPSITEHLRTPVEQHLSHQRLHEYLTSYSHSDWAREQLADPLSCVVIRYLQLGRPDPIPTDLLGSQDALSLTDVFDLANKTTLFTTETDDSLLILSPTPTITSGPAHLPPGHPPRIYVPPLMRPWIMDGCHAQASCHLGSTRTLQLLQRYYWWPGMEQCTKWWVRRCLKCQARKTPRQTVRWPTLSLPLPNGPGEVVSCDYFGPLPLTPRGNLHMLAYSDRFSRHIALYPVSAANFTAAGTANIFVNHYIPSWGCPARLLSDNGSQFSSDLSQAIYKLLGTTKLHTSSYHPQTNGGVERLNHTIAQMLSMMVNERQDDWDLCLPHIQAAFNNSVNAATGLAPNEIHLGRMPRLPFTIFERDNIGGHQSLQRDQLAYRDQLRERQKWAYDLVRQHHTATISRLSRANDRITAALNRQPIWKAGDWVWVYNSASTVTYGTTGPSAPPAHKKLSLNWTGPYQILTVGPAPTSPDGRPIGDKLLFLDLPSDLPGRDAKPRVSVTRCKPCLHPHNLSDIPKHLPADITPYVLTRFATPSPPYHLTPEDVEARIEPLAVDKITGHQLVRGRGGQLAVLYETHWCDFPHPTWERESALQQFRRHILLYWAGSPLTHTAHNRRYRQMRKHSAQRELHRTQGLRFVHNGYTLVSFEQFDSTFSEGPLPKGAYFWYRADDHSWWLGKIAGIDTERSDVYIVRFLDDPGPARVTLRTDLYSTHPSAPPASWCLQTHRHSPLTRGVFRNVDNSSDPSS